MLLYGIAVQIDRLRSKCGSVLARPLLKDTENGALAQTFVSMY